MKKIEPNYTAGRLPGTNRESKKRCKNRLTELINANNECHYCKRPCTKRGGEIPLPTDATIEHLFSVKDIRRALISFYENTVLSCFSCNMEKAKQEILKIKNGFNYKNIPIILFDKDKKEISLNPIIFNHQSKKMEQTENRESGLVLPFNLSEKIGVDFKGIQDRSKRGVLALSKVQAITNDEEDRVANDLLVKVNATIEGGKNAAGEPIAGIKEIRMNTTRQLDGIKAKLMEPEKELLAEAERVNGLRNKYAREKADRIRKENERIENEKRRNDEIARIKAAIRSNIVEGVVAAINSLNDSIRTYFNEITLETYEAAVAKFNLKPNLKASVYEEFFAIEFNSGLVSVEMVKAIVQEMRKENPYEKVNADYIVQAEATLKMWIADLPKKKADLQRIKELEATNSIAAQQEKEKQEEEQKKQQEAQQLRLKNEADARQAEIVRQQNEEKLKNDFGAQVQNQTGETMNGVRTSRAAIIDCKPEEIVVTIGKILMACYGNPKFPGHLKRDKAGVILPADENGVPQYAAWLQPLLDFVAKEVNNPIPGVSFKEVVGVVNKKRAAGK